MHGLRRIVQTILSSRFTFADKSAKAKLRRQLSQVRAKIQAMDPAGRKELQAEARRLDAQAQFGPAPSVDKRAVERAVRAMERAKWERESARGRK